MSAREPEPIAVSTPALPRRGPSFMTAALRVFDLSLGQMLWSRRTVFLALVVGSPLALGVLFRVLEAFGIGPRMGRGASLIPGATVFGGMIWLLYLRFIVPVLGGFYGTSLVADAGTPTTLTDLP